MKSASKSPDFDLERVAELARIALTEEEKAKFSAQLGDVLAYIAQLREAAVEGVEPTAHASPVFNVWAEDAPRPGLAPEAALRNAPAARAGLFAVPRVVE